MVASSTVTSKGQITIPKQIRDALKLEPGHLVRFELSDNRTVVMRASSRDFRTLKGMIRSPRKRPVSVRDMDPAIPDRVSGR